MIGLIGELVEDFKGVTELVAAFLGIIAFIIIISIFAYQKSIKETKKAKRLEEVEKKVQEHPQETQAAWELARVKLETYLDRNLKQVRLIFWLTVFVMLVGFSLIGFGVYTIYQDPNNFNASIVAAVSGIVVNFIGATFLILYRATMSQASEYVNILERINAVGMSVQILETIPDSNNDLKQITTAEIAKQLLKIYTEKKI